MIYHFTLSIMFESCPVIILLVFLFRMQLRIRYVGAIYPTQLYVFYDLSFPP
uniref:Uncharacterized protein n=1 Tax=Arundo donax TaxID=35708 RepID=A0A0A9DX99_ARUDO